MSKNLDVASMKPKLSQIFNEFVITLQKNFPEHRFFITPDSIWYRSRDSFSNYVKYTRKNGFVEENGQVLHVWVHSSECKICFIQESPLFSAQINDLAKLCQQEFGVMVSRNSACVKEATPDELRQTVQILEDQLSKANQENCDLTEKIAKFTVRIEELTIQVATLSQENSRLINENKDLQNLKREIDQVTQALSAPMQK